jgi:hypothetical protein
MSILLSIILIAAIVAVALTVSYQVQKGQLPMSDLYKTVQDIQQETDNRTKTTSQQITPEVLEKVVEIAKTTPESTTITLETIVEPTKPSKKRKYYPKKPKTSI